MNFVTSFAEGITISQSVDKTETAFEDSVLFELALTWQGNPMAYRFPKPLTPYFEKFKVHGFSSSINSFLNDGIEYTKKTYRFTLKPISSGQANITPVTINYLSMPDSIGDELISESFYITIANPLPKKEIEELPYYWYALTILILIGVAVAYWFIKINDKSENKDSKRSFEQNIIEDLDKLYKEAGSDIKIFQTGFSRLMSDYLIKKFRIDIKGLNSEELFDNLNSTELTSAQIERIHKWLTQAERDKYSPISSQPGDVVRLVTEIKHFFEKEILKS
jgi:hypothetical protein